MWISCAFRQPLCFAAVCSLSTLCSGSLKVITVYCDCRHGAEKLLGFLITVGQAVAYVVAGMYGEVRELGAGVAILIVLQVTYIIIWILAS